MNTQLSTVTAQTMSSREIAELTGKVHSNVLRDIRTMITAIYNIDASNMNHDKIQGVDVTYDEERSYIKNINLDYSHTQTLITGYSILLRKKVIDRWQELEKKEQSTQFLIPKTLSEALLLAGRIQAENERLEEQAKLNAPKVQFAEAIRATNACIDVGVFAKLIGWGRNRLFQKMRHDGLLDGRNLPYQRYKELGVFEIDEGKPWQDSEGKEHPVLITKITGKGQVYLSKKYRMDA